MTDGAGSDIVADFRMALELVKRYPVIVAPPLIAMAVVFVLMLISLGGVATMATVGGLSGRASGVAGALIGGAFLFMIFVALTMLINLIASAVVVMMARDGLGGREPVMGDALNAVMARLGDVILASVLLAVIVGAASMLFVLPGLVAWFFLLFTVPAVLLDSLGALDALKRSATLVRDNPGPVLGLVIGAIVALVLMGIVSAILGVVPVLGHLASMLLAGAFFAYLTVVAVRVYQTLPRR